MINPGQILVFWRGLLLSGCLVVWVGAGYAVENVELGKGEAIYRKLCVDCHGPQGEGVTDKADDPLMGDRSLASLTRRIDRTMPEDHEDQCVGEDAAAVAGYIYEAFYSQAAQARLHEGAVRVEMARLTVGQFRNSVADWLGQLDGRQAWAGEQERGLKGQYFGTQHFTGSKERERKDVFERRDGELAFSFGAESPDPAVMGAEEFSIRWSGSVLTEETGIYEFVLKTPNGARLSVNRREPPLIDGWVSSGAEVREEKGSIFLLGGRAYPLVVEFFKFKDKAASVELWWRTPQGVAERIPESQLRAVMVRESPALAGPFPADDRSSGYERGTAVSRTWYDAVTGAAIRAAEFVGDRVPDLTGRRRDEAGDSGEKADNVRKLALRLAGMVGRSRPGQAETEALVNGYFKEGVLPEVALKRLVMGVVMSAEFLYPGAAEPEVPDGDTVASRLALTLWDSVPDGEMRKAADSGSLLKPGPREAAARRMVEDPRTREKLRGFFHHWLELKDADAIAKDPAVFPEFDPELLTDLRRSLDLFLDRVVWEGNSDYRELLRADWLMLNPRLARLYGKEDAVKGAGFEPVSFPDGQRVGVITHPYLLTSFSYFKQTSPIHRGVFLTRNIVGRQLKPPPQAVEFKDGNFDPTLTMREKVTELTRPTACMGCHSTINPLGFSLENYDALGRWRGSDNGKPVDSASDFIGDEGETVRLTRPRDVADFAVGSEAAQRTFIRHLWNHFVKQPPAAYGPETMNELLKGFLDSSYSVRELLVRIALKAAERGLPTQSSGIDGGP